jgi:glycosidase
MSRNLVCQMFNWKLKNIIPYLEQIKQANFSHIQISPMQPTKQSTSDDPWYILYQPISFDYIGNPQIGSKEDLELLTSECHKRGLKVCLDVICNHLANENGTNGGCNLSSKIPKHMRRKDFWHDPMIPVNDWSSRYEQTRFGIGLPDLATENHELQDIIIKFLKECIDSGVDSFRFDATKHIALEDDPYCEDDFWVRVPKALKEYKQDVWLYGEVIECDNELVQRYIKYLDIGTDCCIGSNLDKILIWVESHDTFATFKTTIRLSDNQILDEYEYLISHNKDSHILFFIRPFSNAFISDRIKYINNTYR